MYTYLVRKKHPLFPSSPVGIGSVLVMMYSVGETVLTCAVAVWIKVVACEAMNLANGKVRVSGFGLRPGQNKTSFVILKLFERLSFPYITKSGY